jgi:hypothetical protein
VDFQSDWMAVVHFLTFMLGVKKSLTASVWPDLKLHKAIGRGLRGQTNGQDRLI